MAELVDAHDSKSCGSDSMRVQVPLAVLKLKHGAIAPCFNLLVGKGLELAASEL